MCDLNLDKCWHDERSKHFIFYCSLYQVPCNCRKAMQSMKLYFNICVALKRYAGPLMKSLPTSHVPKQGSRKMNVYS